MPDRVLVRVVPEVLGHFVLVRARDKVFLGDPENCGGRRQRNKLTYRNLHAANVFFLFGKSFDLEMNTENNQILK